MHITYLSTSGHLGGAEAVLREILRTLRDTQPTWELDLVAPSDGELVRAARALGVRVAVVPFPTALARFGERRSENGIGRGLGWSAFGQVPAAAVMGARYVARLRHVLSLWQPEIVHANGIKMHLVARWATPRDARLVWHIHDYLAARPMTSRLLSHTVGRCAAVVATSQSVTEDLRTVFGDRVEIATLHNAVDLDRFSPDGPAVDLDRLAGLAAPPAGVVRVGLIAVLAWWKGHRLFLEAIEKIARETAEREVSVRAYVIGGPLYQTEGSQRTLNDLRRLAAEMGLAHRVGFTGFLEDPARAMRALDIVVHASTEPEPFGLVIAEAMACGRPVVASRSGGAAELITDDVDGVSFEPGSADDLAGCITRLAKDPTRRIVLGCAARATAVRRFDSRRLAAQLVPFYERLRHKH